MATLKPMGPPPDAQPLEFAEAMVGAPLGVRLPLREGLLQVIVTAPAAP
ncbi:hypothetical protein GCM10009550_79090 [Actinocorallia libanotica]|uniref:Uncharacterized protein n=2 Tax=Actinocorallia libanotica TaxID=46162 RepID=A0ABN1S2J6_9ACTN